MNILLQNNLVQRVFTASILCWLLWLAMEYATAWQLIVAVTVVMVGSWYEWLKLLMVKDRLSIVVSWLVLVLLMLSIYWLFAVSRPWVVGSYVIAWLLAISLLWRFTQGKVIPYVLQWYLAYAITISSWYGLLWLISNNSVHLFILVLLVAANDSMAYIGGKLLGRNKLAPRISPGKTYEGAIIGVLASSALMVWYYNSYISWQFPIVLAIFTIAGIGDLLVSMLKRLAGLKDSGNILPGHGGVLDRIDSINAAALPFALFVSKFML